MLTKYIVLGLHGFIGSQLISCLQGPNCAAIGVDIRSNYPANLELQEFVGGDSRSVVVINCATPNENRIHSELDFYELPENLIDNLFEFMNHFKIKKLIHVSTIQVLGAFIRGEVSFDSTHKIENKYASVHYAIENRITSKSTENRIATKILRLTNVYGSRAVDLEKRRTLVPNCFTFELALRQSLTLNSSGRQKRNFVSIEELASYIQHHVGVGFGEHEFDLCSSNLYLTIREMAELCLGVYGQYTGTVGQFYVLSDEPKNTNEFVLRCRYPEVVASDAISRNSLKMAILELLSRDL
jgi:UDP-glucose 4-epimerase